MHVKSLKLHRLNNPTSLAKAQAENLPVLFLGQGGNMLFLEDFREDGDY